MSEYWKSTPKYWCKHCGIFVRDTKIERQNHEATGKHQGALKRFLRDLHRGHEQEEREKERARREVERLKGVASGSSSSASSSFTRPGSSAPSSSTAGTETQRKRQMEQLAEMGVSIPTEFRGDMAMPGEWTVTTTKVIDEDAQREKPVEAKALGVRKREQTEEEKETEDALRGLFKKPKKWGSTKMMPEDDEELDALLSNNPLTRPVKKEESVEPDVKTEVKTEENPVEEVKKEGGADDAATEPKADVPAIKTEPTDDEAAGKISAPDVGDDGIKREEDGAAEATESAAPSLFKKRKAKPKNIRQK